MRFMLPFCTALAVPGLPFLPSCTPVPPDKGPSFPAFLVLGILVISGWSRSVPMDSVLPRPVIFRMFFPSHFLSFLPFPGLSLPVLKSEHTNAPGARCVLPGRCGFEPLCRPSAIPIFLPSLPLLPWRQQGPVSGGSLCLFCFCLDILPLLPYSTSMKSRSFLPLEG